MAVEQGACMGKLAEFRAAAVMSGPPLVLSGLLAANVLAASAVAWEQGRLRGRPLWKLAAVGALLPWAYRLLLSERVRNWGASKHEVRQSLPGDEVVPHRLAGESTHAYTLRARPEEIWPWLVQIDMGKRGGFYSYDWLESLMSGERVRSTERILPEYQHPRVGDVILEVPGGEWRVQRVEPERVFVLGGAEFSWAFVLRPLDEEHTRLLVRVRVPPEGKTLFNLYLLPHLLMQRRQIQGLRRRIEQTARQRKAGAWDERGAPVPAPGTARPGPEQPPAHGG